jgi:uncharacterized protein (UPF0548 family)
MRVDGRLAALHDVPLNFEPPQRYAPEQGWHADALRQALPAEPPGDPVPGGSWEIARRLVEDYDMADPALVRATWEASGSLLGRDMLLQLRLYRLLSVYAGVRVTRVWDETRDGARVFGYEYGTLAGHVEMGRMDYEVVKRLGDGAVEFRLSAHSRASGQGAPWVRLGFRLFGRREQLRFYRRCCERIFALTARELGVRDEAPPPKASIASADTPDASKLIERLAPRRTRRR